MNLLKMEIKYEQGKTCKDDRLIQEERLKVDGHFSSYDSIHLTELINTLDNNDIIIEIGVFIGLSTILIHETLDKNKNFKYCCVDNFSKKDRHKNPKEEFQKNMTKFGIDVITIIGDSADTSTFYKDNSVGFVFIDADHSRNAVIKDIQVWIPKIKLNGFLCGHDRSCTDIATRNVFKNNKNFKRIEKDIYKLDDCWYYQRIK